MTFLFAVLAATLYLAAAVGALRGARRATAALGAGALLFHFGLLTQQVLASGALTLGMSESLSVFAWQAAFLLWAFCLVQPLHALGVVIFQLAAAGAVAATAWPTSGTAIPLQDWKLQLHVVLSLFSAGLLTLAAVQAATLALQDRLLHRHASSRWVQAMPPLQTMETALFQLISLGFFILSLALVTGLLFVDNLMTQHLAHKTVLSLAAWLMFGVLLWGRWRRGWRGRIAVRWTLSGYAVLVLAYFGSKFVLEQILGRHWT
jgi:ABC-type uncharacterized transport system permease subunit